MGKVMLKMVKSISKKNIKDVKRDLTPGPHDDGLDPLLDSSTNTLENLFDDNSTTKDDNEDESIDDELDEDVYEVQEIIDHKYIRKSKYFLIRWKNYTEADDTWELDSALSCPELIAQYLETHPDEKQPPKKKNSKMSTKESSVLKKTPPTKRRSTTAILTKRRDSIILTKRQSSAKKAKVPKTISNLNSPVTLNEYPSGISGSKEEEADEEPEGRQVMKIIGEKIIKRKWYFLVQWMGCDESESTWEEANSVDCDDQIEKFRKLRRPSTEAAGNVTRKRPSTVDTPKMKRGKRI